MGRIAIAFIVAVVGGASFGIAAVFFNGFIPNRPTRWAFYFLFGIPAWLVAEAYGDILHRAILPSSANAWSTLARVIYLVIVYCLVFVSALVTSQRISS